jgi:putative transposon-encoded protein
MKKIKIIKAKFVLAKENFLVKKSNLKKNIYNITMNKIKNLGNSKKA